jgi:hypothetical protein
MWGEERSDAESPSKRGLKRLKFKKEGGGVHHSIIIPSPKPFTPYQRYL